MAGWFSKHAAPLIKLTVIPRAKGSLGFAQYLPDELTLYTQEQLEDMITVALGGRIAEEIFFGKITTGASDDLKKCTQIANGMVTEFGLSPKLGTLNLSVESGYQKNYSQKTNRLIDQEIHRIVNERYGSCKALLEEHKEKIETLAEKLLEKETLSLPDIVDILGPRPYPIKESIMEYMTELRERKEQEDEVLAEQEKRAAEEHKAAIDNTKFDPDAEEVDEKEEGSGEDAAEKKEDGKSEDDS